MPIIKDALDNYVVNAKPDLPEPRSNATVGASEIGQCLRKTFYYKNEGDPRLGVDRDPEYQDNWGARRRGSTIEQSLWVPALRAKYGTRLKYAGKKQRTFAHGYLSATPDGMVIKLTKTERREIAPDCGDCVTVECKTADPRTNLAQAKEENVYQTHVQLGILRNKTTYRPTHAVLSYIDASFWNEVKEFVITYDPKIFAAAQQRAELVLTANNAGELQPEGWIAGGHECRYCPFLKPCGIERRNLPFADEDKPLDPQYVAEITDLARVVRAAEVARDKSDALMREKQDVLKSRLRDKGVRKVPGVVTWSSVKGRESYDNKAIRTAAAAAGVDVEKFSTVGDPTDRLAILVGDETP
jgi:hypothetical protein